MEVLTCDFSEAVDFDTPIPPGVYKARIVGHEVKKARSSDLEYVNWKCSIFGAEGSVSTFNSRTFTLFTMLSGKGASRMKKLFDIKGIKGQQFRPEDMYGLELEVALKQGYKQDGSPSNFPEVAYFNSIKGSAQSTGTTTTAVQQELPF